MASPFQHRDHPLTENLTMSVLNQSTGHCNRHTSKKHGHSHYYRRIILPSACDTMRNYGKVYTCREGTCNTTLTQSEFTTSAHAHVAFPYMVCISWSTMEIHEILIFSWWMCRVRGETMLSYQVFNTFVLSFPELNFFQHS